VKKQILILLLGTYFLSGCNTEKKEAMNPFLTAYTTPFGVPPFDQIRSEHYIPAFEKGMEIQQAEIDAIVNNPDATPLGPWM